jgi:hypothetical protein
VGIAIETYTSAIVDLGAAIGLQLLAQTKEIEEKVDKLSEQVKHMSFTLDNRLTGPIAFVHIVNLRRSRRESERGTVRFLALLFIRSRQG